PGREKKHDGGFFLRLMEGSVQEPSSGWAGDSVRNPQRPIPPGELRILRRSIARGSQTQTEAWPLGRRSVVASLTGSGPPFAPLGCTRYARSSSATATWRDSSRWSSPEASPAWPTRSAEASLPCRGCLVQSGAAARGRRVERLLNGAG